MTLTEVLNGLRVDDLKPAAKRLGVPPTLTRKTDLVLAVEHYLEENLDAFLGQLGDNERLFLAEAAYHGGRISSRVFEARYESNIPRSDFSRRSIYSTLTRLVTYRDESTYEWCLPKELIPRLKSLLPKPPQPAVKTVDQIPALLDLGDEGPYCHDEQRPIQVFEGEKTAFAELRRVLNLVQAGKVRVQDKSRRPNDAAVRLLTTSLVTPDLDLEVPAEVHDPHAEKAGPVRAHAWAALVQQCGWAKPKGGLLTLTKAGKDLLGGVSPAAFRDGFQHFLGDSQVDELNRIHHIRGQSGKAKRYMMNPSERREAICDSMADWPVGKWIAFDEAFRFIDASGRQLDVSDKPYYLYFGDQQYGNLGDAGDDIERQYLRAFFMEPLTTLGVVEIAYVYPHGLWPELSDSWGIDELDFCGRYDGLAYVRLSSLGAYCLYVTDAYAPPAAERRSLFEVFPNRELAVSGSAELTPADRATLELFAKQAADHLWRIEPQRILDYIESGGSVEDVTRFLMENSVEEIPHTIDVFLKDLTGKLDAVQGAERAILVQMKDAEAATRVAHDRQTKSLCRQAGDQYLVVLEKNEQAFRRAMKKLGYVVPR